MPVINALAYCSPVVTVTAVVSFNVLITELGVIITSDGKFVDMEKSAGPVAPTAPVTPAAPVAPTSPVAPVTPAAPVAPTAPAAPVAPTAPVAPVVPI